MVTDQVHSMNLLKKTSREAEAERFSDVIVLHINHCMDNSFYFTEIMNCVFAKAVFVATPYNNRSMDSLVADYMFYTAQTNDDSYILKRNNELLESDSILGAYCELLDGEELNPNLGRVSMLTQIMIERAIVKDIIPELEKGMRLLIFEDGGENYELLRIMFRKYPILQERIIGSVEQTTSGTRRYLEVGRRYGIAYPCASVARSRVKMSLEAVFIGQRIVEELNKFMYTANSFLNYQRLVLMGYGVVGRSVAISLEAMACRISCVEPDQLLRETALKDGVGVLDHFSGADFEQDTVIIGCAGQPSFTDEMLLAFAEGKAENLFLASASSKNIEFSNFTRRVAEGECGDKLRIVECERAKYYTRYELRSACADEVKIKGIKSVYLFADGMPVNFFSEKSISLTHRLIDIVFAEMLLLGMKLCEFEPDKRLYLLGDDEEMDEYVNEEGLLDSWFEINNLSQLGNNDSALRVHPNAAYLRTRFVSNALQLKLENK